MGDDTSLTILNLPPGEAWVLTEDWNTATGINNRGKEGVRDYMMSRGISASQGPDNWGAQYQTSGRASWVANYITARFGAGTAGTTAANAARIQDRLLIMPIVVGGGGIMHFFIYPAYGYGTRGYQAQMITGAVITNDVGTKVATAPGAPTDFKGAFHDSTSVATLSWGAPVSDGGSAITGYQLSINDGSYIGPDGGMLALDQVWIDLPADATSYEFAGLDSAETYNFTLRAVNGVVNAAEVVLPAISYRASGNGAWTTLSTDDFGEATGIEITTPPDKVDYMYGEELDFTGLVVSVIYSNGMKLPTVNYTSSPSPPAQLKTLYTNNILIGYRYEFACWDLNVYVNPLPVSSVKVTDANGVPVPALVTVNRGSTVNFGLELNEGSVTDNIVWSVNNPALATVNEFGTVSVKTAVGTVILTAKDSITGVFQTITLRII